MADRKPKPKKHYYIMRDGVYVGETWAVSPAKAINNYWWKEVKQRSEYTARLLNPSDFDAVES